MNRRPAEPSAGAGRAVDEPSSSEPATKAGGSRAELDLSMLGPI